MSLSVTWHSYDSITSDTSGFNLNDLGGSNSFELGMRWSDYLTEYAPEWHPHLEAIRKSIVENEVWAGGEWHQDSPTGVPVLSDGHFMICSFRAWGDLLAAVWSSELERDFSYMDFYYTGGRLPNKSVK